MGRANSAEARVRNSLYYFVVLPGHGGAASRVCTEGISDPGLASSALAITKQARGRNLREFTARWRTAVEPTSRLEPTSRPQSNGRSTMNGRPSSATTTTTDEELLGVVPRRCAFHAPASERLVLKWRNKEMMMMISCLLVIILREIIFHLL